MSERLETLLKSRGGCFLTAFNLKRCQTEYDAISSTYAKGELAGTEMMISVFERDIAAERLLSE